MACARCFRAGITSSPGMAPTRWILEATRWMLMDGGRTSDGELVYVKDSSRRRSGSEWP